MWIELLLTVIILALLLPWLRADPRTVELGNKIPGPKSYPIIGNLLDIPSSGPEAITQRAEMIKEYGHVCRLWLGNKLAVLISDPKDTEAILSSSVHIDKSEVYDFFHPWLGTGLLTSTGEKWHSRRKAITPTFHFRILEQFLDVFNRNGEILLECLKMEVGKPHFDVQPYISRYALDVICESAMGTQVNSQLDTKSEYLEAVRRICEVIFCRISKPWLWSKLAFALSGSLSVQEKALKILHGLTNKVIEDKRAELNKLKISGKDININEDVFGMKKKTAFLELLLQLSEKSKNIFQTDSDIREEVDTFMFEGHDTTTSSVCFTLYLLGKHPEIQEKLYEEISSFGITDRNLTLQDLQDMKYLERVIKESLRLYPSVPIIGRKIKDDVTVKSGYVIPSGTLIGLSSYFIHRNTDHYNDPERFNPDNFLIAAIAERHPYAYIPFSAGPRNCIGQKFAMMELKATIAKIVNAYKIEYAGPEWDVMPKPALILQSLNNFHIKIQKR